MDPLVAVYDQQQQNVNSLKHRIRFPVGHGINLPPSVDLRPWMTEIKNQGDMDSCAANAVAGKLSKDSIDFADNFTNSFISFY
jgi:hypothetical protein